jgi:hypothetical protein
MALEGQGMSNQEPGSSVTIQLTCTDMWSVAQDFAHRRMAHSIQAQTPGVNIGNWRFTAKFLLNYNVRARRIAASYARLYLETEEHGDPSKKGRYYWMAMGAFASKTVACVLEHPAVKYLTPDLGKVVNSFGKGNLWLFYDVAPWHWVYSQDPVSFGMCKASRNAQDAGMEPTVKRVMLAMPWAADALPKIKQFKYNSHLEAGFNAVKEIEALPASNIKERPDAQLANLMAIAKHEQGEVLQPLIYDDDVFAFFVAAQRLPLANRLAPPLELVFAAACETHEPELKSVAPEGTRVEEYKNRMEWITKAADKFHKLMQTRQAYMESELKTIASWVDQT